MVQHIGRFCSNQERIGRTRKEIKIREVQRLRKKDTVRSGGTVIRKAR